MIKSLAQARRKDPGRVKREFKQAWDVVTRTPEWKSAIKRIDDGGDAEENLRVLIPKFVSFDDPYSMDVLNIYCHVHFGHSAQHLIDGMHILESNARIGFKLSERESTAQAVAEALRTKKPPAKRPGRKLSPQVDGRKLKDYRQLADLTQQELADEVGIDVTSIQRGEAGCRWAEDTFRDVAQALSQHLDPKISIEDLKTLQK